MRAQKIHLIGQHPLALQINVFGVVGRERNRQQLHPGLLGSLAALAVIAGLAGGDDVVPVIGAALDDGRFLVVEASGIGRLRTVMEWPRLYRGRLHHVPGVAISPARRLDLSSGEEVLVDCDGEVCGRLPASYLVAPRALTVCVPRPRL